MASDQKSSLENRFNAIRRLAQQEKIDTAADALISLLAEDDVRASYFFIIHRKFITVPIIVGSNKVRVSCGQAAPWDYLFFFFHLFLILFVT
jgi:hypothetical protein